MSNLLFGVENSNTCVTLQGQPLSPTYFHLNVFNKLFLEVPLGGLLTVILHLQFVFSVVK